jgi:hypothetical protein
VVGWTELDIDFFSLNVALPEVRWGHTVTRSVVSALRLHGSNPGSATS